MQEKNNKKHTRGEHRVQLFCAVLLCVLGCFTAVAGFYAPPHGEIHGSVLVLFGEILTFIGAIFGIDYHYKSKK